MQRGQLVDRDGARFEQPSQVGRQIGHGRLESTRPRVGHVAKPGQQDRVGLRRRIGEQRGKVGVGLDVARPDERCGFGKQRRIRRVAADGGNRSKLVERLGQGSGGGGAGSLGSDR
jgi:hypothetical protein